MSPILVVFEEMLKKRISSDYINCDAHKRLKFLSKEAWRTFLLWTTEDYLPNLVVMKKRFILVIVLAGFVGKAWATVDATLIDNTVSPCDDFYQYACGSWLKRTALPADRPTYSRGFTEVEDRNYKILTKILDSYSKGKLTPKIPQAKQLGMTYQACMNEALIESRALEDFKSELIPIQNMKNQKDLPAVLARLHLIGVNALFSFSPDEDLKNPSEKIVNADQGGMGLPTRDHYFSKSDNTVSLKRSYEQLAEAALIKAGYAPNAARESAKKVLRLEEEIAKGAMAPADRRDPTQLDHRIEREGLLALMADFQWPAYFSALAIPKVQKINVAVPAFFRGLNSVLKSTSSEDLQAYLTVRLFVRAASAMDHDSLRTLFKFYSQLYGIQSIPPRQRHCVTEVTDDMGFALGRAFVESAFSKTSKSSIESMVRKLQAQMAGSLRKNAWMDESTRFAALNKLKKQLVYIGHPTTWRDYSGLSVTPDSMLRNRFAAAEFNNRYEFSKLDKKVDRSEWSLSYYPSDVNATNTITQNVIKFPAGILQPPNFQLGQGDAVNYGAIGTIIGHEIIHGYDDQGSHYDERGSVRNWWTEKTRQEFKKRTDCIVKQFDTYPVGNDLHVNGRLVQGEAIGDLGGMKLAYSAWKQGRREQVTPSKGKFTGEQMFFLSIAQAWCSVDSLAFERFATTSDPHPLNRFRVNGTVRNIPEFAVAFSCKAGSVMAPLNRCEVW